MGWRGWECLYLPSPLLTKEGNGAIRHVPGFDQGWRGYECKDHWIRRWMLAWGSMPTSANLAALLSDYASLIRPTFSWILP